MPYSIYRLTSPSAKVYIGISIDPVSRWKSHIRRSREPNRRHPLYDAIRKYGAALFSMEVLSVHEDRDEALRAEISTILEHGATDRGKGYNISPGGDYDCTTGPEKFWREIRQDEAAYARYRKNLSDAILARVAAGLHDSSHLVAANLALSARERWRRIHRATRVARRVNLGSTHSRPSAAPPSMSAAVKAAWDASPPSHKKRASIGSRKRAAKQWAERTDKEVAEVAAKISGSVKALHDDPAYRARNLAGLAKGRANMDRAVQGAAASAGIKKFWVDLKADPIRYAEHIKNRRATLMATLKQKGLKCKE